MDVKRKEMDFLTNSIAAYAHIKANLESFGLYFIIGVSFGLVLIFCLLVIRISRKPQTKRVLPPSEKKGLKDFSQKESESEDEAEELDGDEDMGHDEDVEAATFCTLGTTVILKDSPSTPCGAPGVNVFASAEELERAQRLEERERIIREIWRNGQPDILGSGTGTIGRVHYY
ncbi:protein eva-1B-like [Scleropages formosus]|uniref:Eva-1 homolog Ba (C. elegans) n=1 Tax=Scleropages formosus TaxID=113540 RepID=A0A0P7TH90_SCLFO|nr:protein eva-1 homolog B [Scleropages formosus]XP_018596823.1 protein eva-1 homolog B [Scleropages formosus]KPP60221.1 protein eva-1B-like [Scleropages formosus]